MPTFPPFLEKTPVNRIALRGANIQGVEGYVFDGLGGSQVTFWECTVDTVTDAKPRDFDEYLVVVEGEYTVVLEDTEIPLGPGREYLIPRGARVGGRVKAGTRTIHVLGTPRVQREPAPTAGSEGTAGG